MTAIRAAHAGDAEELSTLARDAYAHYVERMGKEPAPMREDYRAAIDTGGVWVAEDDRALRGLLVLKFEPDHLLLDNIAVSREVRGTGLGARLLAFTEERARAHGLPEIRLYTNEAMTENLSYYPRHGYVETHRGVQNGYRRVFFTKHL
ncbi:GNAT family N-acetyltransferase [Sciscionella sediminilitoris]|uniref:GNAT family N-acetyltransferase n=1 Tax=Sciscionella sediminilitoris TaxID=1445613 RepID=UPI0004DFC21E|nr:GNAT family N-acetyltransferase [Sciscionella sp. SE31]